MDRKFYNQCITITETAVYTTKRKLREKYNIKSGPYYHFTGLCDEASNMIVSKIRKLLDQGHTKGCYLEIEAIKEHIIHGEQKHLPVIDSLSWPRQHTWLYIEFCPTCPGYYDSIGLYIDATSEQFKDLYNDIPSTYISTIPPKWYYPDKNNPLFNNGIIKIINDKVKIKKKITRPDLTRVKVSEGIIEFLQYDVWGYISDVIHYIKVKIK